MKLVGLIVLASVAVIETKCPKDIHHRHRIIRHHNSRQIYATPYGEIAKSATPTPNPDPDPLPHKIWP